MTPSPDTHTYAPTRTCARSLARALAAVVAASIAVVSLLTAAPAASAASGSALASWHTDGQVYAVARADGSTYIGGTFTTIGYATGGGAMLSTTGTGVNARTVAFPHVLGTITAAVSDGSGGSYIAGSFTSLGTLGVRGLAHVRADGTVDPNWSSNVTGTVSALALSGSDLYVGGDFAIIGGQLRSNLAKISATTGIPDPTWNPGPPLAVSALAVSGTDLYVGGTFTGTIGGQTRNYLAKIATTGTGLADAAWNPAPAAAVTSIVVSGSYVYVGGAFTGTIGGQPRNRLAKLSTSTGLADAAWNPNVSTASSSVDALATDGTNLYVGGSFTTVTSLTRNRIARVPLSGAGGADSWNPGASGAVSALLLDGTSLYVGGAFATVASTTRSNLARLTASTGTADTTWNPSPSGAVSAIAMNGTSVFAGGSSGTIATQARNNIARIDADGLVDPEWNPSASAKVASLYTNGSVLYAGGTFTTIGGQTRNRAAMLSLSGSGRADATWNPNVTGTEVTALAADSTYLYLGGTFTKVGATSITNLARVALSGAGAQDATWKPNPNAAVQDVTTTASAIYAAGSFTSIGAIARTAIAKLSNTGAGAGDSGFNATAPGGALVTSAVVSGSDLYVGGAFSTMGGQTRSNIAKLSATSGAADGTWNPGSSGLVTRLALAGSDVYVGGLFNTLGSQTRRNIGRVSASGAGATDSWDPSSLQGIGAIAVDGTDIYVGMSNSGGNVVGNRYGQATRLTTTALTMTSGPASSVNDGVPYVTWDTSTSASTEIYYGPTSQATPENYPRSAIVPGLMGTVHATSLHKLANGTYHYRVRSCDGSDCVTSGDGTFTITTTVRATDDVVGPNTAVVAREVDANGDTYLAGLFTAVGKRLGHGVRVDLANGGGLANAYQAEISDSVKAVVPDGTGGFFIGGLFTYAGGLDRNRLAHILPDGGVDPDWNPDVNGTVEVLTRVGNLLYIGGSFSSVGGQAHDNIARVSTNGSGAVDATWTPSSNGSVTAIAVTGSSVFIGGAMTMVGGATRTAAAKLTTTGAGAVDPTWNLSINTGTGLKVNTLFSDGTSVYVGGKFGKVGATTRNGLAKVTASGAGTLDGTWNPAPSGTAGIDAIASDGTWLYVGGGFTTIGGQTRSSLARVSLTGSGTADAAWTTTFTAGSLSDLALYAGSVYVAGSSSSAISGTSCSNACRVTTSGAGSVDTTWAPKPANLLYAFAFDGQSVYLGGGFTSLDATPRSGIVKILTGSTGEVDPTWNPQPNALVNDIKLVGTDLYVAGSFSMIGGQSIANMARISTTGTGAADPSWNPAADNMATQILIDGGHAYVSGAFTNIGGLARPKLAKLSLSGSGTADAAFTPAPNATVSTLALDGSMLYASGTFTAIGGQAISKLARVSTSTGAADAAWNPAPSGSVNVIEPSAAGVFVGGSFTTVGGQTRSALAKLSTTGAGLADPTWNPNPTLTPGSASVVGLKASGSLLYVSGLFTDIGGITNFYMARVSTTGAGDADPSWRPSGLPYAARISVEGSLVRIMGLVGSIGSRATLGYASIHVGATPNSAPTTPLLAAPADSASTTDTSPDLSATFGDPDGGDTGTLHFEVCSVATTAGQSCTAAGGVVAASGASAAGVAIGADGTWTTTPDLTASSTYYWHVYAEDATGATSSWTATRTLTINATITAGFDTTTHAFGAVGPGASRFATTVATITTNAPRGYVLRATDTSDAWAANCACGDQIADWTGTDAVPTEWGAGASGFIGVTVRDTTGTSDDRLAKWGPANVNGWPQSNVTDNYYAGLLSSSAVTLHSASARTAPSDTVTMTFRLTPGASDTAGAYTDNIDVVAVANP